MKLLLLLFTALLRLYPAEFREEFGGEMRSVFGEALQDASGWGRFAPARLFLHELKDLPSSLIGRFWAYVYAWAAQPWNDQDGEGQGDLRPSSYLDAGLAGLPHLLFALALYLPLLVSRALSLAGGSGSARPAFWLLVAAALFVARRRGWPRWSSSWLGYGLVFLLDLAGGWFRTGLASYCAALAWLSLAALLLFWLTRRDWIGGLLAVLPVSPMWFWLARGQTLASSTEGAALYVSLGLMLTLAVVAIARLGRWQTALLLLLALILATGMPESFTGRGLESAYLPEQPDPAAWAGIAGWMASYTVTLVFTAPLWLVTLMRQLQRRRAGQLT